MLDDNSFIAPVLLSPLWLILGCVLVAIPLAWVGLIFWMTRERKQQTIATLSPKPVFVPLADLKTKYLALIGEIETAFSQRSITPRQAHQKLSLLTRLFVFECSGFRAHIMTLSDLEKGRFPHLTEAIRAFYPAEFTINESTTTPRAIVLAKELVKSWA